MIKGLENLLRRFTRQDPEAGKPAPPTELTLDELGLQLANHEEWLEVRSRWGSQLLFRLRGQLDGSPRRATDWTFPIRCEQGPTQMSLGLTPQGFHTLGTPELTRAGRNPLPPDAQSLEFLFVDGQQEVLLTFRLPQQVTVADFKTVLDTRPLFRSLPTVHQMAAVLGAVATGRRAALKVLEGLVAQATRVETGELFLELRKLYPEQSELADATVRKLGALLTAEGNSYPLSDLAAMGLFAELERGALSLESVRAAASQGLAPPVSACSAFLVSRALLVDLDSHSWDEAFQAPDESHTHCRGLSRRPPAPGILQALRGPRSADPLALLGEVALQTNSRRVGALVSEARSASLSGELLANQDQAQLHQLLVAAGCQVDPVRVAALTVFVDIEAGLISLDMLASSQVSTSLYSVMAVAGAFGVPLRALSRSDLGPGDLQTWLTAMSELCAGCLLAPYEAPGEGKRLRCLATPEDLQDLAFTGQVLARLPMLERLSEADLQLVRGTGQPFAACFAPQAEAALTWGLGDTPKLRFEGSLLAQWRASLPESFPVVTCDRDHRADLHLRLAKDEGSLRVPAGPELSWSGQVMALASPENLALPWSEITQELLLGTGLSLVKEAQTMARLYPALRDVLNRRPEYQSLGAHRELWEQALRQLGSGYFKSLLAEAAPAELGSGASAKLAESSPDSLEMLAELAILGRLDSAYLALELLGPFLEVASGLDRDAYQRLRRERVEELLRNRDGAIRRAAVQLLGTGGPPKDRGRRASLEFELTRACSDPDPTVSEAAFCARARASLGGAVPFPPALRRVAVRGPGLEGGTLSQLELLWPQLDQLSDRAAFLEAAGEVQRLGRLRALADLLWHLGLALEDQVGTVLLCLVPHSELTARRLTSLQRWKFFAYSRSRRLAELVKAAPAERLWADYLDFLRQSESLMDKLDAPTRLGSGRPVQLFRLTPPPGPWESDGVLSPFFMTLVEWAARQEPDQLRVCRVRADLSASETTFIWNLAIDARLVDVYEPRRRVFTPWMHHLGLTAAEVGYEDEEWDDFEALVTLFTQSRPAFRLLPKLAREVAHAFELPQPYTRQILKMLVDLGADSIYEL